MGYDSDDKPRRSWSEIDKMREKSSHRRDEMPKGRQERLERSAAYRSYKSQLDKMFDGGALPDALKEKLAETGVTSSKSGKKALLENILSAKQPRETLAALEAYKLEHGFPESEDVLAHLLELDDEDVVLEAIVTIGRLKDEGRLKRGSSLKARIKTAQMTVDSPEVNAAAKEVLRKL